MQAAFFIPAIKFFDCTAKPGYLVTIYLIR